MNQKVSVLMSVYNEPIEWINESISSILEQTYSDIEFIIIIDNPENMENINFINNIEENNNNVKVIRNKQNIGLVDSLNKGLEQATGEYIARMDADDISEIDRIEKQVNYLESNKLDFIFSGLKVINEDSKYLYSTNLEELSHLKMSKILNITNNSNHPTWFLKKKIYDTLGGYRKISHTEDYDFLLRALNKGYQIGKMPGSVIRYRIRESSVSRKYSLEQFLNSRVLLLTNKNRKMEDIDYIYRELENVKQQLTDKNIRKYKKSEMFFFNGISSFKNKKKVMGVTQILYSMIASKYFREKNIQLIRYKRIL